MQVAVAMLTGSAGMAIYVVMFLQVNGGTNPRQFNLQDDTKSATPLLLGWQHKFPC
jgi:hypothetical protein